MEATLYSSGEGSVPALSYQACLSLPACPSILTGVPITRYLRAHIPHKRQLSKTRCPRLLQIHGCDTSDILAP